MKFLVVFVIASVLGPLSIHSAVGQECDAETYQTLVESFLGVQSILECVLSLNESYTLGNEKEYTGIAAIVANNQSGFDAIDQGNCSALNDSLLAIVAASYYLGYAIESDYTAIKSGLYDAYIQCVFPNETCDINYLNMTLSAAQSLIGCYLTLTNGSYPLTEDQAELLNVLYALNETAVYASIANQCDTLNASVIQLVYTINRASELILNGSDTNVSDALNMCLFPEPTCSIEDLNATLDEWEPVLDCLCELDYLYNLTDDVSVLLDIADAAYVNACTAVNAGDNCTDVSDKVQTFKDAIDALTTYILADGNSSSELISAVNECVNGSLSCNTTVLDNLQSNLSCIIALNSTFNLTDDKVWIVWAILEQNATAYNASQALNCSTVDNATATILKLIQNFTDLVSVDPDANYTGLACALDNCLYGNVSCNETCSIEDLNATLSEWDLVFDCLCYLENLFNLTDPESEMLDDADIAYVKACLAVDGEDNCTVVSDDVQLFIDAVQGFINYVNTNNESSVDLINAVNECVNSSSTAE